jgi:predicted GIY-YIG superfamily endonuclease
MTSDNWFFYLARCGDGSLYSGITNNLDERIKKHSCGKGAKYTASHLPVALAHSEAYQSQAEAMAREIEVKGWPKSRKELLAASKISPQKNKTRKVKFPLSSLRDPRIGDLVKTTPHTTLALWAIDCAERVIPYFEQEFPQDKRPRTAIETLKKWIKTGVFSMAAIRKASLDAHAAARDVGEGGPARSAAHAAGQAVATAHVRTHSMGPAIYALQAISRAVKPQDAEAAVAKEREWQYKRLLSLIKRGELVTGKPVPEMGCKAIK